MEFKQSSNLTIAGQRCHEYVGDSRGTQSICFLLCFFSLWLVHCFLCFRQEAFKSKKFHFGLEKQKELQFFASYLYQFLYQKFWK